MNLASTRQQSSWSNDRSLDESESSQSRPGSAMSTKKCTCVKAVGTRNLRQWETGWNPFPPLGGRIIAVRRPRQGFPMATEDAPGTLGEGRSSDRENLRLINPFPILSTSVSQFDEDPAMIKGRVINERAVHMADIMGPPKPLSTPGFGTRVAASVFTSISTFGPIRS